MRKNDEKRAYSMSTSYPISKTSRLKHGLQLKKRKRASGLQSINEAEFESDSSDEDLFEEESD